MRDIIDPLDLEGLQTYPIAERPSKVSADDFARPWSAGGDLRTWLAALPGILAADDLRAVIDAWARATRSQRRVVFAMGAHVIKVGLSPLVIDLMRRGAITAIAMNGAGIIHDLEIALTGRTSEEVSAGLGDGTFGMARETGELLCDAVAAAATDGRGLGASVGQLIVARNLPQMHLSILAAAFRRRMPATVHVAMGTDILHMHPAFDPAKAGLASHRDFRLLAAVVSGLQDGVYLNVGSAVILPEVFLKAITVVRNLGHKVDRFTAVNLDFIRHYRPLTNVVQRPTAQGGRGINLVGHHEILLPLLAAGVIEALDAPQD
jgi:hypothetical protein